MIGKPQVPLQPYDIHFLFLHAPLTQLATRGFESNAAGFHIAVFFKEKMFNSNKKVGNFQIFEKTGTVFGTGFFLSAGVAQG